MSTPTYNFNAGPAALPKEALQKAQQEFMDFNATGMSVMELSHRSDDYRQVHDEAEHLLRELMDIPAEYEVLFLQGGASLQFAMLPMNYLHSEATADYIVTGSWSKKAVKEATLFGNTHIAATSENSLFNYIPGEQEIQLSESPAYIHLTSNNTIYGTQWQRFPDTLQTAPLICDMSSDILSRPVDVSSFAMIYAGAQKNLGPSGVTVVIRRKDWMPVNEAVPTMLKYETHAKAQSLFNTPPTFAIYMLKQVLQWVKDQGGVQSVAAVNKQKAMRLYNAIEESNGFYTKHAATGSESMMNVTFTLKDEDTTKLFLQKAKEQGFVGLGGHRSVGGCRASIYNAVPLSSVDALAEFMNDFQKNHS
ncbi:3-phosphoserine/phosphohydroxythreonine transaminase [Bacillaceae bacterium SIJ1]|uniref:3-phosphoserine/phosphohydroxythreonine transaminase n=1 Tax=Litoribacterium kuwaitense TaxID=1398745 RepID=UPI0013ECB0E6|nr:3-phosphoserine/phosphohydroxythreonine transaminase [Litoribacterium kuwaitense]NGP43911.1 3-phosphoserine/phosphohydroxythreonine transaminase [Litoribacterium kuwaitense]